MEKEISESQLIVLAKNGDEESFKRLIDSNIAPLKTLIKSKYGLSDFDLDDVSQDAIIQAWQKLSHFRSESKFNTWLFVILRNKALDFLKKRSRINKIEIPAHHEFSDSEEDTDYEHISPKALDVQLEENARTILEKQELLKTYSSLIKEILAMMRPKHSEIIKLAFEEHKSYKEISEMLNLPLGSVMSRLFMAKKSAQKLMKQYAKQHDIQLDCVGQS